MRAGICGDDGKAALRHQPPTGCADGAYYQYARILRRVWGRIMNGWSMVDFRKYTNFWRRVGVSPSGLLFNAKVWFCIIVFGGAYLYQLYLFARGEGFHLLIPYLAFIIWYLAYTATFELILTPFLWNGRIRRYAGTMSPLGEFLLAWAMVVLIFPVWYIILTLAWQWYQNKE